MKKQNFCYLPGEEDIGASSLDDTQDTRAANTQASNGEDSPTHQHGLFSKGVIISVVLSFILAGVLLGGVLLYQRQNSTQGYLPPVTDTNNSADTSDRTDVAATAGKTIDMTVTRYSYSVKDIPLTKGQPLQINITNTDTVDHGFFLPSKKINVVIPAGQEIQVKDIMYPNAGDYEYISSVYSGPGFKDMRGMIKVQ